MSSEGISFVVAHHHLIVGFWWQRAVRVGLLLLLIPVVCGGMWLVERARLRSNPGLGRISRDRYLAIAGCIAVMTPAIVFIRQPWNLLLVPVGVAVFVPVAKAVARKETRGSGG